jgi:hypothetical protein
VENNEELNSLIDENNIKKKDDLNTKIKSINPEKVKEEKVEKKIKMTMKSSKKHTIN